jgi:hypothetical protein
MTSVIEESSTFEKIKSVMYLLHILDPFLHKEPNMCEQILEKKWKDSGIVWEAENIPNNN